MVLIVIFAFGGVVILGRNELSRSHPGKHIATETFSTAEMIANTIEPGPVPAHNNPNGNSCPALENVIYHWNQALTPYWHISSYPATSDNHSNTPCHHLARQLGSTISAKNRLFRFPSTIQSPLTNRNDFTTRSPWQLIHGCITWEGAAPTNTCIPSSLGNEWLDQQLLPANIDLLHEPTQSVRFHGKQVDRGADVRLQLDSGLQNTAEQIAACFTGQGSCEKVLSAELASASAFRSGLRTGALGLVLIEIESGRIVAMSGALSSCSRKNMRQPALQIKGSNGKLGLPAFRPGAIGENCPQIPDARHKWLLSQHPALWPVSPGSTMKTIAVLAGLETNLILSNNDQKWRSILAESHDQDAPRRLALTAQNKFLHLLESLDFNTPSDILQGKSNGAQGRSWNIPLRSGKNLIASNVSWNEARAIRIAKESGQNADAMFGHKKINDYLAARKIMDSAIGGGDTHFAGALGLAELFRRIELRARGYATASAVHLVEGGPQKTSTISLEFTRPENAKRLTGMLSGVTASNSKGTAAGACRKAFEHCPAEGIHDLWGKTGTADAVLSEGSTNLNPGVLPTKLFGAVFTSASGKGYAIAAMALRGREAQDQLELQGNAAAEAVLTLIRHMRLTINRPPPSQGVDQ